MVGIDIQPVEPVAGCSFVQADAFEMTPEQVLSLLGAPAGLVVSDMAPSTTGARDADAARQIALAAQAFQLAREVLMPGGHFVAKIFDGQDAPALVANVRPHFESLRRIRPQATRKASREFFLIGLSFKPTAS